MTEEEIARAYLHPWIARINSTPALVSLLYDANMLPEQTVTVSGARRTVAVVMAYMAGVEDGRKGLKE